MQRHRRPKDIEPSTTSRFSDEKELKARRDYAKRSYLVNLLLISLTVLATIGIYFESHESTSKAKTNNLDVNIQNNLRVNANILPFDEKKTKKATFEKPPLLDIDGTKLHVIFSTDCSAFQHWQSYSLFFSALRVKQPGYVTRIASGCTEEQEEEEKQWHDEHITKVMSERFLIHFTPHFSSAIGKDGKEENYKYYNKPFGLRHWMENGEQMGIDESTGKPLSEDTIVILIDPDQVLLRPIRADFTDSLTRITRETNFVDYPLKVSHGHPIAQKYGFGAKWRTFQLEYITGSSDSPALKVSFEDGLKHYTAGPPYLATARDFYNIALKWTQFVPLVHAEYPHLLGEMYAYCVAAAHLELPHLILQSLMVSDTNFVGGEGWKFIDNLPGNVCSYDFAEINDVDEESLPYPNVVHFCQRYIVDVYAFGKRRMPQNFFTCESPLLVKPPVDLGEAFPYQDTRVKGLVKKEFKPEKARRNAFVICTMTSAMNAAGEFFKEHHCPGVESEYSLDLGALG